MIIATLMFALSYATAFQFHSIGPYPQIATRSIFKTKTQLSHSLDNVNKNFEKKYWLDPRIHSMGNTGMKGLLHATLAPLSTYIIDQLAYSGKDIRSEALASFATQSVCDFGCGTGFSTPKGAVGIDTSDEMLFLAKIIHPHKTFIKANMETWGKEKEFDIVFISFVFHEMPRLARIKVLENALKVAKKQVVILDIDPSYTPSEMMLSGEPYLMEYKENITNDLLSRGFIMEHIVKGHAVKYVYNI